MSEIFEEKYDVLVVSSSDKMNNFISRSLPEYVHGEIVIRNSASQARRELLTREYDIVIVYNFYNTIF